jgi:hyperosmotically inducible periplasmic protein
MRKSCMFLFGASMLTLGLAGPVRADQLPGNQAAQAESQIQMRLQQDTDLKNNRLQATVDNGVVTLKGTVDTEAERTKAGKLAMVKGVSQVDNQLRVGSDGAKATVSDAAITARLKTELVGEDALRSVRVQTNNAVVNLSGTVTSEAARQRALELAQTLTGVSRVEDNIKVQPPSGTQ